MHDASTALKEGSRNATSIPGRCFRCSIRTLAIASAHEAARVSTLPTDETRFAAVR